MHIAKNLVTAAKNKTRELAAVSCIQTADTSIVGAQTLDVRVQLFKRELLQSRIDLQRLKELAYHGIPDKDGLRALTWKLLLGYLPTDSSKWDETLAKKRTQYLMFCQDLIVNPKDAQESNPLLSQEDGTEEGDGDGVLLGTDVTSVDHPLSLGTSSKWHLFFKDGEVVDQIERDVMRTHPDMHFFSGDSPAAEVHRKEMKRALFMYAKLNPGLRYIQGMNELYAPLYYTFRTDADATSARHAEADAFFCFVELISEFRDHFCQQLDNSQSGIKATIRKLMHLLRYHDAQLWHHLEGKNKVDPQFFAFRWITLLLTQEFAFPDAVRIWDMILSDPQGRMDSLMRTCVALLVHVRQPLLAGDFAQNVKLLQSYPAVDVNVILQKAAALQPCAEVLGSPL